MNYLILKDIKLHIDIKRMFLSSLLFVLIFVFFTYGFSNYIEEKRGIDSISIGLIDMEKSMTSKALVQSFQGDDKFTSLFNIVDTEDTLQSLYDDNTLSAIVTIPAGFSTSLLHYENEPLSIMINPEHTLKATIIQNTFDNFTAYIEYVDAATYSVYTTLSSTDDPNIDVDHVNNFFSIDMIFKALGRNAVFEHNRISTFPSSNSKDYFLASILTLIIMSLSTNATDTFRNELRLNTYQRFYMSGANAYGLILSKIGVLSFKSFSHLFVFLMSLLIIGQDIGFIVLTKILLLSLIVVLCFIMLSGLIGLVFKNVSTGTMFTNIFLLVLCILGGNFFPLQLMPKYIQNLSMLTPNYWLIKSYLYIITDTASNLPLIVGIVLLAVILLETILIDKMIRRLIHE